jgi:hypothetical protein
MGRVVLRISASIAQSDWFEIDAPILPPGRAPGHKYSRGLVHCLAAQMPGAIAWLRRRRRERRGLCQGFHSCRLRGCHSSIVQTGGGDLQDERIGCILVGPGLGDVPQVLTLALTVPPRS